MFETLIVMETDERNTLGFKRGKHASRIISRRQFYGNEQNVGLFTPIKQIEWGMPAWIIITDIFFLQNRM